MAKRKLLEEHLKNFFRFLKTITWDILLIALGLFFFVPGLLLYTIISIPAIVYRFIISKLLSKCFRSCRGFRSMVSVGFSTAYAAEYLFSVSNSTASRNAVLIRIVLEDHIHFDNIFQKVTNSWINAKCEGMHNCKEECKWKYPEFRHYLDRWMGYAYWREDSNFDVNNHFKVHQLSDKDDLNEFVVKLSEDLYSRPFIPNLSPWEVHVIQGWQSAAENNNVRESGGGKVKVTGIVIRTHHVLGDGGSIMLLILEDLLGYRLEDFEIMHRASLLSLPKKTKNSCIQETISFLKRTPSLLRDLGCVMTFALRSVTMRTRFHVSIHKHRNSEQILEVAPMIPVDRVKCIRNRFGVSFGAVLLSSLTAAMASCMGDKRRDHLILAAPRPFPGRSKGLENHITFAAYKLPLKPEMGSVERLLECDKVFKEVNRSLFPAYIFPFIVNLLSCHILPVAKFGLKSVFETSISNNLGPSVPLYFERKSKMLEISGGSGPFDGVTGLMFTGVSHNNQYRLQVVGETACVNKQELKMLMGRFVEEINYLHKNTVQTDLPGA